MDELPQWARWDGADGTAPQAGPGVDDSGGDWTDESDRVPPEAGQGGPPLERSAGRRLVSGRVLLATAAAALVVVVGAVGWFTHSTGGGPAPEPVAAPTMTSTAVSSAPEPWCPQVVSSAQWSGNGPGGFGSGPDAIFGFQYAFFVLRDPGAVRSFATPEMAADQLTGLEQGIPATALPGSEHCVRIHRGSPSGFEVQVQVRGRDGVVTDLKPQTVMTQQRDGRNLLSAIVQHPREDS